MKKIAILIIFSLTGYCFAGCATKYGAYDPKDKQALRTLAGGVVGALVAWNVGGAIVGALIVDIANLTIIKYEDKQLEDREEAARRFKDKYKAEEKKEDKKAEEKKEEDKKRVEEKKEENKKRVEEKEEEDKRAEKKIREEKRVQLYIEDSAIITRNVKAGSIAEANVQYTLLASIDVQQIKITEKRILYTPTKSLELDKREVIRKQGTHLSTIKFTVPEDTPKGLCILYTTVSDGKYAKTAKSVMVII
jgi:flagellar biosynthesis GTPase FlhF